MAQELNPKCNEMVAIARELITRLPDRDVRSAFLFGSVGWGDADEASDLDIMLLLDRPEDYREVSRVRMSEIVGRPLPNGPLFADVDRISAQRFDDRVSRGGWHNRVVNSVVLVDTDDYYENLSRRINADWRTPQARRERFAFRRDVALRQMVAARRLVETDGTLAHFHARLGLESARGGLLEISDDRYSVTHFLEGTERALARYGRSDLYEPFLHALSLDAGPSAAERGLSTYRAFANALERWVTDPDAEGRLSDEDVAWARFTYCEETYEEIDLTGRAGIMSHTDFHVALRSEPELYEEWVAGLRLESSPEKVIEINELTERLLEACDTVSQ